MSTVERVLCTILMIVINLVCFVCWRDSVYFGESNTKRLGTIAGLSLIASLTAIALIWQWPD